MSDQVTYIELGEKLVVHNVSALYQDIKSKLHSQKCEIDASKIAEMDGAGIQFAYYISCNLLKNKCDVVWLPKPSLYFLQQVHLVGIEKTLFNK